MTTIDLSVFDGVTARAEILDNGLAVVLLPHAGAESVVTVVCYRAGSRDENPDEAGLAHFLEHMMFKGSVLYPPGAIDSLTQRLGGTNNAFTSHDVSAYHFQFERRRLDEALRIEADRMRGLSLLPEEVESEREVILEEIRMVEDDPWDALEQAVARRLFGGHPYARPVLGTRRSLRGLDAAALRSFHGRHYHPGRAVLVVAGGLPADAMGRVEAALGNGAPDGSMSDGHPRRELDPPAAVGGSDRRVELRRGEMARLLVAHPAPAVDDPLSVHLRLALTVLASGRASRIQRELVEENPLALWAAGAVSGHSLGGMSTLTAEAAPGVEPARLEAEVCSRVDVLAASPPSTVELERAKRVLFADWVFLHERIAERALSAALEHALFFPGFTRGSYEALARATAADVSDACAAWLSPATRIVGWSLPAGTR
ncbi:MAG: pitrilysin family protein [Acidobacteria bacterium]|nr:pitrilysin family protein [Acidobacteriota bacterium]